MTEITGDIENRRHSGAAVILSLIMPGLGHIYCGKIVRGLVLGFLAGLGIPITFWALAVSYTPARMIIIAVAVLVSSVVAVIAVVDSYYAAKHTRLDYQLKDYNRWYVYVLLLLMSTGGSIETALYVKAKYLEAFWIASSSMYPTMMKGDRVLANKIAYGSCDPKRGDVVVFPNPDNRRENNVKRVVALAGDTVEIKNGELYVNGQKLKREKLSDSPLATLKPQMQGEVFYESNGRAKYKIILVPAKQAKMGSATDFKQITVPKYHCFVLGDNRNASNDSRSFGPIPVAGIKGRFDYLYFPAERWSRFGKIE